MATETAAAHSSVAATAAASVIEARAMAKHVRMSPQKVRLVIDLIRGERAESALQILKYTQKRASRDVEKVLRSAIANAERKAEDRIWQDFMKNINETRAASGMRLL